MLGAPAEAERVWADIERETRAAAARVPAALRGKRVYFEVDATPYAAGPTSFIGETLSALGLANAMPAELGPFPKLNPEYVVRAQPDIVMAAKASVAEMPKRPGWYVAARAARRPSCGFPSERYELHRPAGAAHGRGGGALSPIAWPRLGRADGDDDGRRDAGAASRDRPRRRGALLLAAPAWPPAATAGRSRALLRALETAEGALIVWRDPRAAHARRLADRRLARPVGRGRRRGCFAIRSPIRTCSARRRARCSASSLVLAAARSAGTSISVATADALARFGLVGAAFVGALLGVLLDADAGARRAADDAAAARRRRRRRRARGAQRSRDQRRARRPARQAGVHARQHRLSRLEQLRVPGRRPRGHAAARPGGCRARSTR